MMSFATCDVIPYWPLERMQVYGTSALLHFSDPEALSTYYTVYCACRRVLLVLHRVRLTVSLYLVFVLN